jgi:hypothetical protein
MTGSSPPSGLSLLDEHEKRKNVNMTASTGLILGS